MSSGQGGRRAPAWAAASGVLHGNEVPPAGHAGDDALETNASAAATCGNSTQREAVIVFGTDPP